MILTVTLNPAVDVSLTTDRIIYDDRTYITSEREQVGGKGLNAARVLHAFGAEVEAIATAGGRNGERFRRLLDNESGLVATLIPVQGETRRNLAIVDEQGLALKLDQRGTPLTVEELARVEEAIREKLPRASWLTLTGSAPPDTPDDLYARLIREAQRHGVRTLLDTTGPQLRTGLAAHPTLSKPNRPEAERLLGRALLSEDRALDGLYAIRDLGPEGVVLSLGAQGALAAWEGRTYRAVPPAPQSGSPIGAGDILGAVLIWGLARNEEFREAFAFAVAAATVAASLPGLETGTLEQARAMRKRIDVRTI